MTSLIVSVHVGVDLCRISACNWLSDLHGKSSLLI